MNLRSSFGAVALLCLAGFSQTVAAAEFALNHTTSSQLSRLQPGESLSVDAFPVGPTSIAAIRFQRVQIYSDDAHVYLMMASGPKEVPRSNRIFLRGYAGDGSARVAIALNPDLSVASGGGSGPEGSFMLRTGPAKSGTKLVAKLLETGTPGAKFDFRCGNELENMDVHELDEFAQHFNLPHLNTIASTSAVTASTNRSAIVGVDTDSLFMSRLFNNNTATATNWIASMFNIMNIMYERDLSVRLQQGTTFLQTVATDPYTNINHSPADTFDVDTFGAYWQSHHAGVARAFAILLSGQIASTANSCGASGIAWINQYCQTGFLANMGADTVGSYSVNQVCTSINIDPDGSFDARIVGHELGHNFGAYHTHCTNTTTGAAPTGTNTIDVCYNAESGQGCYAGVTACPTSGPGAPAGTLMSYCNNKPPSGCGSDGQNVLQFHPTQINQVLLPRITNVLATQQGCLNDDIFASGFQYVLE